MQLKYSDLGIKFTLALGYRLWGPPSLLSNGYRGIFSWG